jgi:hypothetical protein
LKRPALLVLCLLVLAPTGCGFVDGLIADKLIEDQSKIRCFDAIYQERGTIPGDPRALVRTRVRYVAPSSVLLEVVSPEEYAGDAFAYVGSDLWFYSRQGNWGIHVRSVAWDAARFRDAVRASVKLNRAAFDYSEAGPQETVAGRVATVWDATPKEEGALLLPSRLWLDEEFSIPLGVTLGNVYASRFEQVVFNRGQEPIAFEPPPGATWFEFDMADPPLSRDAAVHFADFGLLEPRSETDLARTRILRARTESLPIVTLVYERGPFFASVTETQDRGYVDPGLRGIDVDLGGATGRLSFAGTACVIVFARSGVAVSVVTNLPPHEAVAFARTLGS